MIVLDTNVVILYINDDATIVSWINRQRAMGESFSVSTITVVELLGFPKIIPQEVLMIELWLKRVLVVDVDLSVAREAARIRRELKLTMSASVIAATAVLLKSPVATRDVVFKKIRDISVIRP